MEYLGLFFKALITTNASLLNSCNCIKDNVLTARTSQVYLYLCSVSIFKPACSLQVLRSWKESCKQVGNIYAVHQVETTKVISWVIHYTARYQTHKKLS